MKTNFLTFCFIVLFSFEFAAQSTATSNVKILEKTITLSSLNDFKHKLWIYLPPNYHSSSKRFPVIYMHDGQNLFDNTTSFMGEWSVDETLNNLYEKTKKGFIVVGIENGGTHRTDEYTPWEHKKYGGGKGALYVEALISDLKPYIDANFRTKSQQKHTAIVGSSLGGLISYYAGLKHSATFGKVGAMSPSFWFSDEVNKFTADHAAIKNVKLFLLVGDKEGETMVEDTNRMRNLLISSGFKAANLQTKVVAGAEHNEAFWKSEFESIIRWLFELKDI